MTNEVAEKMLEAKLKCLTRETSGTDINCNHRNCDECSLCYEQGNMGEQKEALNMAIKALKQQPCEDAVSKKNLKEQMIKYGFHAPDMTVTEFVEDLSPITPRTNLVETSQDILDKISAEIDQKQYDFMDDKDYDEGIRFGLMLAYQIIDKYRAESEDKG